MCVGGLYVQVRGVRNWGVRYVFAGEIGVPLVLVSISYLDFEPFV